MDENTVHLQYDAIVTLISGRQPIVVTYQDIRAVTTIVRDHGVRVELFADNLTGRRGKPLLLDTCYASFTQIERLQDEERERG